MGKRALVVVFFFFPLENQITSHVSAKSRPLKCRIDVELQALEAARQSHIVETAVEFETECEVLQAVRQIHIVETWMK